MNLKAKRLVRTTCSEQYALFDLDRTDENFDPMSVGKLDVHYTDQGIYGTLLFWEESCERYAQSELTRLAEALLAEFNSPMGVPAEFAVEFFTPSLDRYELLTNIEPDTARPEAAGEDASSPGDRVPEAFEEAGVAETSKEDTEPDESDDLERLDLHRRVEWRDED
jgi:hypothetical protein